MALFYICPLGRTYAEDTCTSDCPLSEGEFVLGNCAPKITSAWPTSEAFADKEGGQFQKNILTFLGDYWSEYYRDFEELKTLATGAVSLYSQEYRDLLGMVLGSSLIDTPAHLHRGFRLFVFEDTRELAAENPTYTLEGIEGFDFFASSIFEPELILEKGVHFQVENSTLTFFVDIFSDPVVVGNAYASSDGKFIMLWALETALHETFLYERFGVNLYSKELNSEAYKALLTMLQFFFVTAKTVSSLEVAINALMGIPFVRSVGETVLSIEESSGVTSVATNKNVYRYPSFIGEPLVAVGDILTRFQLIARLYQVIDYVTDPDWFVGSPFCGEAIAGELPTDLILALQELPGASDFFDRYPSVYGGGGQYGKGRKYGRPGAPNSTKDEIKLALKDVRLDPNLPHPLNALWTITSTFLKHNLVYIKARFTEESYNAAFDSLYVLKKFLLSGFPVYLYPVIDLLYTDSAVETAPECTEHIDDLAINYGETLEEASYAELFSYSLDFSGRRERYLWSLNADLIDYGTGREYGDGAVYGSMDEVPGGDALHVEVWNYNGGTPTLHSSTTYS